MDWSLAMTIKTAGKSVIYPCVNKWAILANQATFLSPEVIPSAFNLAA